MPDISHRTFRPDPPRSSVGASTHGYAELQAISNFSFLEGGSHPEELVARAAELGYRAIGIADRNSLAGVVRAHTAARNLGVQFLVGCRLELEEDAVHAMTAQQDRTFSLIVYPMSRKGYGGLCTLLTIGKRRAEKGGCSLRLLDFLEHYEDLLVIVAAPRMTESLNDKGGKLPELCRRLLDALPTGVLSIATSLDYSNGSIRRHREVVSLAQQMGIPLLATNNVLYHSAERGALQDVISCIRHGCTVESAGYLLAQNRERYLKPAGELCRLFRECPEAIQRSLEIAERAAGFSLEQLRYEYPDEVCPEGRGASEYLVEITWEGAHQRFPEGIPQRVKQQLLDEFELIRELGYERYFLTCYDIVKFARSRGILCQGRGAAANSAVCYCLGITSVDPSRIDLLFARFVSKERNEPPDIDIDFEHERREEVIQYIYERYGRDRAGLTAEVVTYRKRSALREVGKVLGLSLDIVDRLAKSAHRWIGSVVTPVMLREIGLDPDNRTVVNTLMLSDALVGFPRHLSQHVGGFIISKHPLSESVPILNASMEGRTIIEWDKDDIEALGMLKIDILALGMLTCVRKALGYVNRFPFRQSDTSLQFHSIPAEDPRVYEMCCKADTLGVFQIESRAQMSMLPRLKPRCFYDLVIEVAIVRPGPIQGDMVHPYLRRRAGLEKPYYPDERVREILGKTLGVPLFQEQAMRLAMALARFSAGEAEQLRRAMASWKRNKGVIETLKAKVIRGMTENGYSAEFAEHCMNQIKGFSEYGFPESHAASFALIVYASAWLKCWYPAHFAAALLNSQPMGFYAPSQIVRDAQAHGVEVRPLDINASEWDCSLERREDGGMALRLGMRLIRGFSQQQAMAIKDSLRRHGRSFASIAELWRATRRAEPRLLKHSLELLADADAFGSIAKGRREALWEIASLAVEPLPLDEHLVQHENAAELPPLSLQESMFADYERTGLSLKAHPIGLQREALTKLGVVSARELRQGAIRPGTHVSVAGIAIIRQRPQTARGVVFITLEDETGIINLVIRPAIFERYSRVIITSPCLLAHGKLERIDTSIYITPDHLSPFASEMSGTEMSGTEMSGTGEETF